MSTTGIGRTPWLAHRRPGRDRGLRLFCFPHAGGMAHAFRDWSEQLPHVEVCPVQLPGRGLRLAEPPHRSIAALVDDACAGLLPYLDGRFALFGHSMGAVVAFELARVLRARHGLAPVHLFVSAHRAPDAPRKRPPIHALPDAELIAELVRMRGTPEDVARNPELMALLMPVLRADFEAIETYAPAPGDPLDCPVTVFGGQHDPLIGAADLHGWCRQTSARFALHMVQGDHFFITANKQPVLDALAVELSQETCHVSVESARRTHPDRAPRSPGSAAG
jgi:medium-chain acyl-[acyl-carrier-protein] hydrolase